MALGNRYRALWTTPQARPVLLIGALARLPVSMYALAILLLVLDRTGSLAQAGLTTGAAAIGFAVTGPALGRLVDRIGAARPLITTAVVNAGMFAALIAAVHVGAPLAVLAGCAALVGGSLPPVPACQRALWRRLLADRPDMLDTAMALDSFQLDVFLILGPLLVTGVTALAGASVALAVTAGLLLVGGLGFAALPACRALRGQGVRTGTFSILGPLRSPAFLLLAGTIGAAGMALGLVRIALIGFSARTGHPGLGGVLYTAVGLGSAVGGVWYGSRRWSTPVELRYAVLLGLYALGPLALLVGQSSPAMFALAIVTGLALSPVTICEFTLIGRCVPASVTAEAYAWATTVTFVGNALGNAIAGVLIDHATWRSPAAAATLVLAAAAAVIRWRQPLLRKAIHGAPA